MHVRRTSTLVSVQNSSDNISLHHSGIMTSINGEHGRNANAICLSQMVTMDDLKNILQVLRKRDGGDKKIDRSSCPTSEGLPDMSSKASTTAVETATAASSSEETGSPSLCLSHTNDGEAARRAVRFADECGSNLVTKAVHSTYWWDDMVLGVDRCPNCGHVACPATVDSITDAADASSRNGEHQESEVSVMGPVHCESCGASFRTQPPGELFQFIEELSEGVEATLLEPTLMGKKRRKVFLYTEDDGESISWIETGSSYASTPHSVPCNTLLEVKDGTGLASRMMTDHHGIHSLTGTAEDSASREPFFPAAQGPQHEFEDAIMVESIKRKQEKLEEMKFMEESLSEGGLYYGGDNYDPKADYGYDEDACGKAHDVRIKLRWRLNPKSSVKKVTIVDVRCSCPAVFARGMMRLQEHNTDLLE